MFVSKKKTFDDSAKDKKLKKLEFIDGMKFCSSAFTFMFLTGFLIGKGISSHLDDCETKIAVLESVREELMDEYAKYISPELELDKYPVSFHFVERVVSNEELGEAFNNVPAGYEIYKVIDLSQDKKIICYLNIEPVEVFSVNGLDNDFGIVKNKEFILNR